jgi:hypothetical protein
VRGVPLQDRSRSGLLALIAACIGIEQRACTKCDEAAHVSVNCLVAAKGERVGSAFTTALALAGVLAFAGVLVRFASALTLAGILPFTGVLAAFRVVELLHAACAIQLRNGVGFAVGRSARDDSGDCCCHQD